MELQKYVNRIRCEEYHDFTHSTFRLEYEMAASLVKRIILANEYYINQSELERFCNENQIPTIISFLGDRGVGKSSAMLSFAYFLHSYNCYQIKEDKNEKFWLSNNINFYVLPKIDAAMLAHGESLFDVVLAKMWDVFYDEVEHNLKRDHIQEQVRRKFEEVKHSYNCFCAEKKEKNVSRLTELHELSESLNLRKDFCELVEAFSKYMDKEMHRDSYVVFAIDDLDMVTDDTYLKLEELRLLLTIPKVLVLITADLGHLTLNIENVWAKQLKWLKKPEEANFFEKDRELFKEYSVKYLAKILPRNMRIFMPYSKKTADEGLKDIYAQVITSLFNESLSKQLTIQKLIYVFLRKKIGLSLYYERMTELDVEMSLRETVNILAELGEMSSKDEKEVVKTWMRKEMVISSNRINMQEQRELVKKVLDAERKAFDGYLDQFCSAFKGESLTKTDRKGYWGTIERLVELCNEKPEWNAFERLLIWSYSLKVKEELEQKPNELLTEMQKASFLDTLIPISFHGLTDPEGLIVSSFSNIVVTNKTPEDIYEELDHLFFTLLFFDIQGLISNATIKETSINEKLYEKRKKEYTLTWNFRRIENSNGGFNWFFPNLLMYSKLRKSFVDWVNKVWPKIELGTLKYAEETKLSSSIGAVLSDWGKSYKEIALEDNISINDIMPLDDIGVIMSIVNKLNFARVSGDRIEGAHDCLLKTVNIIKETYEENEKYYNVFHSEGNRYGVQYAELFGKLLSIMETEDFSKVVNFSSLDRAEDKLPQNY